jgi:trimeric autotransporter adhesin
VAVDRNSNIYIADQYNHRIRRVNSAGIIDTIAGSGRWWPFQQTDSTARDATVSYPESLACDSSGIVYIGNGFGQLFRVDTSTGFLTVMAGGGSHGENWGDGGPLSGAALYDLLGLSLDGSGNLLISDGYSSRIRVVKSPLITP